MLLAPGKLVYYIYVSKSVQTYRYFLFPAKSRILNTTLCARVCALDTDYNYRVTFSKTMQTKHQLSLFSLMVNDTKLSNVYNKQNNIFYIDAVFLIYIRTTYSLLLDIDQIWLIESMPSRKNNTLKKIDGTI